MSKQAFAGVGVSPPPAALLSKNLFSSSSIWAFVFTVLGSLSLCHIIIFHLSVSWPTNCKRKCPSFDTEEMNCKEYESTEGGHLKLTNPCSCEGTASLSCHQCVYLHLCACTCCVVLLVTLLNYSTYLFLQHGSIHRCDVIHLFRTWCHVINVFYF